MRSFGLLPRLRSPDSASSCGGRAAQRLPTPPTSSNHSLEVFARMKPGVTIDAARADMSGSARCCRRLPTPIAPRPSTCGRSPRTCAHVRSGLLMLLAAGGLRVLIACVNVATAAGAGGGPPPGNGGPRRARRGPRTARRSALTESVLLASPAGPRAAVATGRSNCSAADAAAPAGLRLQHLGLDRRVLRSPS